MGAVILVFFWYTVRYIFDLPQYPRHISAAFYNPQTFTISRVFHGIGRGAHYIGSTASDLVGRSG